MKTVNSYQCEICQSIYTEPNEAEACERSHHTIFEILDFKHEPDNDPDEYFGFPNVILIDNPNRSGRAAEYVFNRASSVEDFEAYHPDEWYNTDEN